MPRGISIIWGLGGRREQSEIYSSLTAADEKVTLSMDQVKSKPQPIVFPSRLRHPASKPRYLPVESRELWRPMRVSCLQIAQKPVQALRGPHAAHFPTEG